MEDVAGWGILAMVLLAGPALIAFGMQHTFSRKPVAEKYEHMANGGLVGVFDSVWSPSAHEAAVERDRQTKRTAPAPSPGDPPSPIIGDRITLTL
nr:hypothetical protein [Microbacterium hydrocarbonoxydans]